MRKKHGLVLVFAMSCFGCNDAARAVHHAEWELEAFRRDVAWNKRMSRLAPVKGRPLAEQEQAVDALFKGKPSPFLGPEKSYPKAVMDTLKENYFSSKP